MHTAGQCSTCQSIKHRLCVRTRKVALECTEFTGKRVVENARQALHFYSGVCDNYINQITPFSMWIMFLIPGGALRNEKQRSLGFVQPRISQMLRVHKDLLLDLLSSSAVQMENYSGQFEPKGHLLFGRGRIH